MLLDIFEMIANCYGGSNVVYMLMLHSKYCINVPIGSRSNTWSGNIWNVPNLLLAGKWWVPSTRAYNVLKMFSLVSRPPRPQCLLDRSLCSTAHSARLLTLLDHPLYLAAHSTWPPTLFNHPFCLAARSMWLQSPHEELDDEGGVWVARGAVSSLV